MELLGLIFMLVVVFVLGWIVNDLWNAFVINRYNRKASEERMRRHSSGGWID